MLVVFRISITNNFQYDEMIQQTNAVAGTMWEQRLYVREMTKKNMYGKSQSEMENVNIYIYPFNVNQKQNWTSNTNAVFHCR